MCMHGHNIFFVHTPNIPSEYSKFSEQEQCDYYGNGLLSGFENVGHTHTSTNDRLRLNSFGTETRAKIKVGSLHTL